jgi:hypothetical protein
LGGAGLEKSKNHMNVLGGKYILGCQRYLELAASIGTSLNYVIYQDVHTLTATDAAYTATYCLNLPLLIEQSCPDVRLNLRLTSVMDCFGKMMNNQTDSFTVTVGLTSITFTSENQTVHVLEQLCSSSSSSSMVPPPMANPITGLNGREFSTILLNHCLVSCMMTVQIVNNAIVCSSESEVGTMSTCKQLGTTATNTSPVLVCVKHIRFVCLLLQIMARYSVSASVTNYGLSLSLQTAPDTPITCTYHARPEKYHVKIQGAES